MGDMPACDDKIEHREVLKNCGLSKWQGLFIELEARG